MRLNIGCGDKYWPGYINVDSAGDPDVTADIKNLPFEDDSADEIHAIHVFEHLHRLDANKTLTEWKRVLKDGGKLVLELPCLDKVLKLFQSGEKDPRMTMFPLYGNPVYRDEAMLHRWCWSVEELTKQLEAVGLVPVFSTPHYHYPQRDMRCEATKTTTEVRP